MEAKKDIRTGIIRHTYGTVYPKEFKEIIAESGLVGKCSINGVQVSPGEISPTDEAIYDVMFNNTPMNVISTGTRVIIVGTNEQKMLDLYHTLRGSEWEYDDTNKFDYMAR